MDTRSMRHHDPGQSFDLALTVGPVAWGKGRWPNVDWIDGAFVWIGLEDDDVVYRRITQNQDGVLTIDGTAELSGDLAWLRAVLGIDASMPAFTDSAIARLAGEMPGLRPFANGDLFDGVIGSIVGQSISVAAAATTERRLASLVHPGVELYGRHFYPSPRPQDLASTPVESVRGTGVTWRRAEAICAIARSAIEGGFPLTATRESDETELRTFLRTLPLVGPWTAESALLWGLGFPDIYPTGDVALLRAVRTILDQPDMTMKELDRLAPSWSPGRAWAARLLWTRLLGPAPTNTQGKA